MPVGYVTYSVIILWQLSFVTSCCYSTTGVQLAEW